MPETAIEPPIVRAIGFWHGLFILIIVAGLIETTVLYLKDSVVEITVTTNPQVLGSNIEFNASPQRTRTSWQTHTNEYKGYSFSHPPDWIVIEHDGFINSTRIYPPEHEFEIIYSDGEIPPVPGKITLDPQTIRMDIQENSYTIQEQSVQNAGKFFQLTLLHPSKPISVMARTLSADVSAFDQHKQTILDIIASTAFITREEPILRSGFTETSAWGFKLYYPAVLAITAQDDTHIVWGDSILIFRKLAEPFTPPTRGSVFFPAQDREVSVKVQKVKKESVTIAGEIAGEKFVVNCGRNCDYQIVQFSREGTPYECIFKGSGKVERREFDSIIDAIRIE